LGTAAAQIQTRIAGGNRKLRVYARHVSAFLFISVSVLVTDQEVAYSPIFASIREIGTLDREFNLELVVVVNAVIDIEQWRLGSELIARALDDGWDVDFPAMLARRFCVVGN